MGERRAGERRAQGHEVAGHIVPGVQVGALKEGMRVTHPALKAPGTLTYLAKNGHRAEVYAGVGAYLLCQASTLTEVKP